MSHSTLIEPSSIAARPGRRLTIASYVCTVFSLVAPFLFGVAAITLGLVAASKGDKAGRTAAIVGGVVLTLEMTFGLLWFFGVIHLPK